MPKKGFISIRNQAESNTLELYFLDEICDTYDFWSESVQSKVQDIINQVNCYRPSKIVCIIDSIGGDAQIGLSIYNYLKNCSAKIEVQIIGLAGSIASVIAMAANKGKLSMAKNAFMMIHKAEAITCGTADEIRQSAAVVDKYDAQIADIYSQRTGKSADEVKGLYASGDYWMTGDEAVAQGFADSVFNDTPNLQVAARLKGSEYKNIPAQIRAQMSPTEETEQSFLTKQFDEMKKFFTEITNAIRGIKPAEGGSTPITNQIADAIQAPFEKIGEEIEITVTNQVAAAIKDESFVTVMNAAIKTQVENATKELTTKVAILEQANKDLETEVTNLKGSGTGAGEGNAIEAKVKGKWS